MLTIAYFSEHKRLITILLVLLLMIAGSIIAIQQWLLVDLPHPSELYQHTSAPSTKIFDRHGTLLYEITDPHQGLHTPLALDEIPQACRDATIATEDASFYQNPGVDLWAIVRALYINIRGGEVLSGGSTITQQLARNLLLSPEERVEISLTRKLREATLAWRLARTYSKDEILTLYLNETYYGNLAYGIEAASRTYFGKHAIELDPAECSLLAGLPQSPANYNPLENLDIAKARQEIVLGLMVKHGYMTEDEAAITQAEKLGFAAIPFPIEAPHFVMYIRAELERQFGLEAIYRQGLQVHTTLDLNMQDSARHIVNYRLAELGEVRDGVPARNVNNAAVIVMDPHTGEVLTMLGSPNYFDADIDGAVNATTATRQPGSSIKPFTFAAAFDPEIAASYDYDPLTPASMMVDVRTAFVTEEGQPYAPENYDRTWRGPVLMRPSLAGSYNLIAVKVLEHIGLDTLINVSRSLGITTFDNKKFGLALTLGGGEVRLLEITAAYGALANGGRQIEPITITRVTDHKGQLIYELPSDSNPGLQVLDPRTAFLITDIMSDDFARRSTFGPGSPLQLSRPAAAKTGTTQDWRDNWTIGYSPELLVGVWAGNADNEPMRNVSGVTGAAPIWHDVMELLHKGRPIREFPVPEGIIERTVCSENGLLPVDGEHLNLRKSLVDEAANELRQSETTVPCPHTITEKFIVDTEPHEKDNWHSTVAIDRRNGLRAGPGCSLDFVKLQTFTRYPAAAREWASQQGASPIPTQYSPLCPKEPLELDTTTVVASQSEPLVTEGLVFTSPDPGSVFRLVPNIPIDKQQLLLKVRPADGVSLEQVTLFINNRPLIDDWETMWQMEPGRYTFRATGTAVDGTLFEAEPITIEVLSFE